MWNPYYLAVVDMAATQQRAGVAGPAPRPPVEPAQPQQVGRGEPQQQAALQCRLGDVQCDELAYLVDELRTATVETAEAILAWREVFSRADPRRRPPTEKPAVQPRQRTN